MVKFCHRRYVAGILPMRRKTQYRQSINFCRRKKLIGNTCTCKNERKNIGEETTEPGTNKYTFYFEKTFQERKTHFQWQMII